LTYFVRVNNSDETKHVIFKCGHGDCIVRPSAVCVT